MLFCPTTDIIGRHCRVHNLHITALVHMLKFFGVSEDIRVVVTKLQKPLKACAGVLRPLTIISMGQIHD